MATLPSAVAQPRAPLSKERVLQAAVALADEHGADAVSMRNIAQELGVVPMALYKHVANKNELLDGMADAIVSEIDPPQHDVNWQTAMWQRVLSARNVLLRHRWASLVIESRSKARPSPTPTMLAYLDSMMGIFRSGGFSIDLTHHAMHVMGSRLLGFSQELFDDNDDSDAAPEGVSPNELASLYPNMAEMIAKITHDQESVVGTGCDDQVEFEFALDLVLGGLERLRAREAADCKHPERTM